MKKIHSFDMVYDSQKVYRLMLEAFANPGRKLPLGEFAAKMYGTEPGLLAAAVTLLDNEVCFSTCGNDELTAQIQALTLARETETELADYIFVSESAELAAVIEKAKCGTLTDPHKSAAVIIRCREADTCSLRLRGPGIKDELIIRVPETVSRAMALRQEQFYEYPEGIDLVFITEQEELVALPRLIRQEVF